MSDFAPDRPAARRLPWLAWSPWIFLAGAIPLIVINLRRGRGQFDQEVFHAPVIWRFVAEWPRPRLDDYLSATTPGYHLLMAVIAKFISNSLEATKLATALCTACLLWMLERAVHRRLPADAPRWLPLALVAPILGSMYIFIPGVWLQPDNFGWLGVLAILLIALRPRFDHFSLLAGGFTLLLLVWVRQSHIWAAGVLWVAAWLGGNAGQPSIYQITRARMLRTLAAVGITLPAFATLAYFYKLWGGLTPPSFQKQHAAGFNLATPAFALALIAIFSHFFLPWFAPGLRTLGRTTRGRAIFTTAVTLGLILALIPTTTFLYEPRSTGLWNLVKVLDARGLILFGRTSPMILLLAPIGAACIAAWLARLVEAGRAHTAWICGLGLAGFLAAQTANTNAWQRYLEPFLLMLMILMAAMLPRSPWRLAWFGPAALGAALAALTAYTLWSEPIFVRTW